MKEMNYQLIKAIQNDDVGEITQLPLWNLVVTGKNSSIAKEILRYCVDWDAHKILLELIKNNVFSINKLEPENDFIDQLIDKAEAKHYHLTNILLNIFAGDIPVQLPTRIPMPIKSITASLFF